MPPRRTPAVWVLGIGLLAVLSAIPGSSGPMGARVPWADRGGPSPRPSDDASRVPAAPGAGTPEPESSLPVLRATIPVGYEPDAITVDPSNGYVYVANSVSDNVSVINGTQVVASVTVGSTPDAEAYDPANGDVYVADYGASNLSVLNGTRLLENLSVDPSPEAVSIGADRGSNHQLYSWLLVSASDGLMVINGTRTVARIYSGPVGPSAVSGQLPTGGVATTFSGLVLSPTNDNADWFAVLASGALYVDSSPVPLGSRPDGIGLDPSTGAAWVSNDFSDNVTYLGAGPSSSTHPSIAVGLEPQCPVFDPSGGLVYVSDYGAANLSVVNATELLATLPVGSEPGCGAIDPLDGRYFLPNYGSDNVSAIDGTEVEGSIGVGEGPSNAVYDPANGFVYVQNLLSDSVSVLGPPPTYPVTFTETGLASGTAWTLELNQTSESSTSSTLAFTEANGTYPWSVDPVAGYAATGTSGQVTVDGRPVGVAIAFTQNPSPGTDYSVSFSETGLPGGTSWSVTLAGGARNSSATTIGFVEPNGTYPFSVAPIRGYESNVVSGEVVVAGSGTTRTVAFLALPPGTFTVEFVESGLAAGTNWSVTLNGASRSAIGSALAFPLGNGSYSFEVDPVSGYSAQPASGVVRVMGGDLSEPIQFSVASTGSSPSPRTFLGLPGESGYYLVGAILAGLVLVTIVAWRRGRRRVPRRSLTEAASAVVPPPESGSGHEASRPG